MNLGRLARQAEIDSGQRPGTSTADGRRIAELERENAELRRANEILKAADGFSRGSSTRACRSSRVHRHLQGRGVEPIRTVLRFRPVDLLCRQSTAAVGAVASGRGTER